MTARSSARRSRIGSVTATRTSATAMRPPGASTRTNSGHSPRATGRLTALREGDVLRNRDLLKLELVPNRRCWLYIINIDARDAVSVLFPHAGFARKNPVPASRRVLLPDRKHSFEVDTNGGAETIYVFASLQPDRDLESLIKKIGDERGLGAVAEDPSFGPQGDFRDVIEKKAGESRAAKKYVFAHL